MDLCRAGWLCLLVLTCSGSFVSLDMKAMPDEVFGLVYSAYTINLQVGSPPQSVDVLVDGGLDPLFLFTPNCTQRGCGTKYFYPTQSSSLQYTGNSLNYTYAAGNLNVVGDIAVDQAIVAGELDLNQQVGLINQMTQPNYYPLSAAG